MAAAGVCVVSGLALGIDAAAHRGALEAQGCTLAVLGTGCDRIHPRRNWRLAASIMEAGLIISELPLGTGAAPWQFPRRNRIVAGLCQGTLVVEAAQKSGSLISARLAANEGRDVFAMPGLVSNRLTRGVHQLIREGATLIESGQDVLREMGISQAQIQPFPAAAELSTVQAGLIQALSSGPCTLDLLRDSVMTDARIAVEDMTVELISLEIMGLVASEGGRYWLV